MMNKQDFKKIRYCMIVWGDEAIQNGLGYDHLKKIYHMKGEKLFNIENYNEQRINELKRNHLVIVDRTFGQRIPKETQIIPKTRQVTGDLNLFSRL